MIENLDKRIEEKDVENKYLERITNDPEKKRSFENRFKSNFLDRFQAVFGGDNDIDVGPREQNFSAEKPKKPKSLLEAYLQKIANGNISPVENFDLKKEDNSKKENKHERSKPGDKQQKEVEEFNNYFGGGIMV